MGAATTRTMTVEEFYAFADAKPDHEKWELIGGEPVLNASPSRLHSLIVTNISFIFATRQREIDASWVVLADFGVRVSDDSRPQPDVVVVPPSSDMHVRHTDDPIVAFEVRSPSTRDHDLGWKRKVYTSLPSLTHYLTVAQDAIEVTVFARDNGFKERVFRSREDVIDIQSLDASLSLADIYYRTGL